MNHKYNIQIMSKEECILYSTRNLDEDCIIISINNSNDNTVIFSNNHIKDILKITFDDIEEEYENKKIITIDDAKTIKDFVDKYKLAINNIIIHCTAGISRSGAVGCCLARYLNGQDEYLLKTGKYIPNKIVYKTMCKVLNLEYSDELFKYKRDIRNKGIDKTKYKIYDNYGIDLDDMFN